MAAHRAKSSLRTGLPYLACSGIKVKKLNLFIAKQNSHVIVIKLKHWKLLIWKFSLLFHCPVRMCKIVVILYVLSLQVHAFVIQNKRKTVRFDCQSQACGFHYEQFIPVLGSIPAMCNGRFFFFYCTVLYVMSSLLPSCVFMIYSRTTFNIYLEWPPPNHYDAGFALEHSSSNKFLFQGP